jgi:ribulose kinase
MNEGGQSSTGQLIDFMVTTHPAYPKLLAMVKDTGKNLFDILAERLETMRAEKGVPTTSKRQSKIEVQPLPPSAMLIGQLT